MRTCLNSVSTNHIPVLEGGGGNCPGMGPGPLFQRVFQTKYEIPPIPSSNNVCTDFSSLLDLILARSQRPVAVCCEDSTKTVAEQNNILPSLLLVERFPLGGSHFDASFNASYYEKMFKPPSIDFQWRRKKIIKFFG